MTPFNNPLCFILRTSDPIYEMLSWLDEHHHTYEFKLDYVPDAGNVLSFTFKYEDEAIMFKLTWGDALL